MPQAGQRERRYRQQYDDSIDETGKRANRLAGYFDSGIEDSDPRAAYERGLDSSLNRFKERFGDSIRDLRSRQTSQGALDTGFRIDDEDRTFRTLSRDYMNEASDRALEAEGLNIQRLGMIGNAADRTGERHMAAAGGTYYSERDARLQQEAERRRRRSGITQALIQGGASLLGGPVGGAIASWFTRSGGGD